jgi:RimJ/RimL family protein N-acetyltransferase
MPPFTPITLTTERLTLRWLTEADAPALFTIFSDPVVMRYGSTPPLRTMAEAEALLGRIVNGYQTGSAVQLGIERTATPGIMGTCTLFSFAFPSRRAELGYALGRPFWGAGYMHEALQAFVAYAFQTLNLNRLEADIHPSNTASAKTLERLGFQQEGYLRERWIVSDEVSDTAFYGLLRRDWEQSRS